MENDELISAFRSKRSLVALSKHFLGVLENLRTEHDTRIEQTGESLCDMEEFIYDKHSVEISLAHLTKHFEFLTENKFQALRKDILNYSNELSRSLNQS